MFHVKHYKISGYVSIELRSGCKKNQTLKVGVEHYNLRGLKSEVEIDTGIIWGKT